MIITKDTLEKIDVIAKKMSRIGFGDENSMKKELIERYLSNEVKKFL